MLRIYHFLSTSLMDACLKLLLKSVQKKERVLVVGETGWIRSFDRYLWEVCDFFPHALEGDPQYEEQSVLLASGLKNGNEAETLIFAHSVPDDFIALFSLACRVFVEGDPNVLSEIARLRLIFPNLVYWKQNPLGQWVQA